MPRTVQDSTSFIQVSWNWSITVNGAFVQDLGWVTYILLFFFYNLTYKILAWTIYWDSAMITRQNNIERLCLWVLFKGKLSLLTYYKTCQPVRKLTWFSSSCHIFKHAPSLGVKHCIPNADFGTYLQRPVTDEAISSHPEKDIFSLLTQHVSFCSVPKISAWHDSWFVEIQDSPGNAAFRIQGVDDPEYPIIPPPLFLIVKTSPSKGRQYSDIAANFEIDWTFIWTNLRDDKILVSFFLFESSLWSILQSYQH